MQLYRDSERVSPTGNVTSRGVINQLGRPQLGPLAVLVREAVQNSWDARAALDGTITFGAAGWTLTDAQRDLLRYEVFADLPPSNALPLQQYLHGPNPMQVIAIYDRGTTGLGGPTRADEPSTYSEPRDFVDFLRNVGQPPDKQLAGGTYGYGKAAFYRVSHTQTICVYTRCTYRGNPENRFIAAALGDPYEDTDHVLHTGRHWWGARTENIAEPLKEDAESLAEGLGIARFLGSEERGTVILILQPQLEDHDDEGAVVHTPRQGMHTIAENLLLYFWPKMLKYGTNSAPITFEVSWEGESIALPDPEGFPPLQGFVEAMYHLKGLRGGSGFPYKKWVIASERPQRVLGQFAVQKYPISLGNPFDTGSSSAFAYLNHHTALMRQPELIVKYLPGAASASPQMGLYGVFITDRDVDAVFAESEPPTHDDWVKEALSERWKRTFISVAYRRIGEEFDSFAKPADARTTVTQLTPLGAFANTLGSSLLASVPSNAATSPFTKGYQPPRPGTLTNTPPPQPASIAITQPDQSAPPEKPTLFDRFRDLIRGEHGGVSGHNNTQPTPSSTPVPPPPAPQYAAEKYKPSDQGSFVPSGAETRSSNSQGSSGNLPHFREPVGRSRVSSSFRGEFVLVDGQPALKIRFSVEHGKNAIGTEISVDIRAIIDGGVPETEPPIGGSRAEVIRWIEMDDTVYSGNSSVFIAQDRAHDWAVVISLPDDLMIDVGLTAKAVGAND